MSSSDHVSPHQLAMFMPAGKLRDPEQFIHGDVDHNLHGDHNTDTVFVDKLRESKGLTTRYTSNNTNIYDSIKEKGVQEPVVLDPDAASRGKGYLVNGHHRVAAANDIDPNMEVPVRYDE